MKTKIYITVPNLGQLDTVLVARLFGLLGQQEIPVVLNIPYPPRIPHDIARNSLVKEFLETDCTHMLSFDADVRPPEHILEMVKDDLDIVSGVYHVFNGHDIVPIWAREGAGKPVWVKADGDKTSPLIEVDYVGGGCTLIKRHVFEKFREQEVIPYEFVMDEIGCFKMGEDYDFAAKAQKLGFKLYIDRRFKCGHNKGGVDLAILNQVVGTKIKEGIATALRNGNRDEDSGADARKGTPPPGGTTR